MPKQPNATDATILQATRLSIESAPEEINLDQVFKRLDNRRHIAGCLGNIASKMPLHKQGEHYERLIKLLAVARYQTLHIMDGAALFLELHGQPRPRILEILSDTSLLARKFGQIGGATSESRAPADDFLARQCKKLPLLNFVYTEDKQRVSFSEHALKFIDWHSNRESGCPAMGIPVEYEGVRTTLYTLAWRQYSEEYLMSFQNEEPIVFLKPTDEEY